MTGLGRGEVLGRRGAWRGSGAGVGGTCATPVEHEMPAKITTTNKEILSFIRIAYFKILAVTTGDQEYLPTTS
jgi:hypothetical protein